MEWWYLLVPLLIFSGVTNAQDRDQNGLLIEETTELSDNKPVEPLEELHLVKEETPLVVVAEKEPLEQNEKTAYEVIYNLPQWVDEVTSVCPWRSASDEHLQGYIRLIRTEQDGANQLYVQWMQKVPPNKDMALATRLVDEVKKGPRLAIELPEQQLHSRFCKLTAYARDLDSNNNYRVSLKIEEPGKYQYELIQVLGRSSR